jgi:hypothetical protein
MATPPIKNDLPPTDPRGAYDPVSSVSSPVLPFEVQQLFLAGISYIIRRHAVQMIIKTVALAATAFFLTRAVRQIFSDFVWMQKVKGAVVYIDTIIPYLFTAIAIIALASAYFFSQTTIPLAITCGILSGLTFGQ